jgi:hypothetical protein
METQGDHVLVPFEDFYRLVARFTALVEMGSGADPEDVVLLRRIKAWKIATYGADYILKTQGWELPEARRE